MTLKKFLYSFLLFEILYFSPLNAARSTEGFSLLRPDPPAANLSQFSAEEPAGEIEPSAQSDFTSKATEILTNLYGTYGTIDHLGNSGTADQISESLNKIRQTLSMDTDSIDFQVLGDLINSALQFASETDWAAKNVWFAHKWDVVAIRNPINIIVKKKPLGNWAEFLVCIMKVIPLIQNRLG